MNKINEAIGASPKFTTEPQPLKHLGDKEKTIGFPPINPAPIGGAELTEKHITNMWHNQMKESNWFQSQVAKATQKAGKLMADKKEKKIISGYKNKLMKANNEAVKEYHVYASHPTEFKDCKACRVILNFFKWQNKPISPPWPTQPGSPKDTYASPKWTTFSGQPTTLLVDDPLVGTPKQQHANTCTCVHCEKLKVGAYKTKEPTFHIETKKSPFVHIKKIEKGMPFIISEDKLVDYSPTSGCSTSYNKSNFGEIYPKQQLCTCSEVIIKWIKHWE